MVSYTPRPLYPQGKSPVRAEWGAGPTAGMYTVENKDGVSCVQYPATTTYKTLHINILEFLGPF